MSLVTKQWGYVPQGNSSRVLFSLTYTKLFSIAAVQDACAGSAYELKTLNLDIDGFNQSSYQSAYGALGWISLGL